MKLVLIDDLFRADDVEPGPLVVAHGTWLQVIFYSAELFNAPASEHREEVIELKFRYCDYYSLGPPNDEALGGHPYSELGLGPYSFYELLDSDLMVKLKSYNRFHRSNNPDSYRDYHHYILTFKDQLFECVATGFEVVKHKQKAYDKALATIKGLFSPRKKSFFS
jgi:hypothetical protein